MWSSFVSVFNKEFVHIFRDRATLMMALTMPFFQLILFGFIDQTVHNLPTVVVDQDRSTYSRELMDQMEASKTFKISRVTENPRAAREDITAGRARVGVVIPPDYHNKRTRGEPARILVLIDGSDSTASAQALASINGLVAQINYQEVAKGRSVEQPMGAQPIVLFNPDGRTANYIIPGLCAILLQIVALILSSVSIVRERERGTLEQLMVTPINSLGLMLGKLFPYLVFGLVEMTIILAAMRFGFSVPIRGSLFFLYGMSLIYLFALLSLGLLISTMAQTQLDAQQRSQMLLLPSIFLSGYIFPAEGLPWVLRYLGKIFPATHMVAIMRGIVLRAAGPMELLPNVLALVAISVICVAVSARRFKKTLG